MRRNIKIIISAVLIMTLIISVTACKSENKNLAKGRYVETQCKIPEEVEYIIQLKKLKDGRLALIGSAKNDDEKEKTKPVYYISKDGGDTWDKENFAYEYMKDDERENIQYTKGTILNDENVFIGAFFNDGTEKYYIRDKEGNEKEISLDGKIQNVDNDGYYELKEIGENKIIVYSQYGDSTIYEIDLSTNKLESKYNVEGEYIEDIVAIENSLIVVTKSSVEEFDLDSGERKGNIDKVEKELLAQGDYIRATSDDKALYFANKNGVYRYVLGGNIIEKIIDASLNSFSNASKYVSNFIEINSNEFLTVYSNINGGKQEIMKYSFNKDITTVPENKITLYSLYNNEALSEAISYFNSKNKDTYVKLDVGLENEINTEAEATAELKKLNTKIMAGNGPDILCLDGMNTDDYIDKGILEDISDVVDKDNILENIKKAYENNGKIYQMPMYVKLPVVMGKKDEIKNIDDLDTLVSSVKEISKNNDGQVISNDDVGSIAAILYTIEGNDIVSDGSINKSKVKDILKATKEIHDAIKSEDNEYNESSGDYSTAYIGFDYSPLSTFYGLDKKCDIGNLGSFKQLAETKSINEEIDCNMLTTKSKTFIPSVLIGVNSKGKNVEISKKVISKLFSAKVQENSSTNRGFPVNEDALEKLRENPYPEGTVYCIGKEDGTTTNLELKWIGDDDLDNIEYALKECKTALKPNRTILNSLSKYGNKYVHDKISLDEAVKAIISDSDLDLQE